MMLGEETKSADYWKACGDEALSHGIKGVIMMGAHWDARGVNRIDVSMNPAPNKSPVAYVHPRKYKDYELVPDLESGKKCIAVSAQTLCIVSTSHNPFFVSFRIWGRSGLVHDIYIVFRQPVSSDHIHGVPQNY